MDFQSPMSKLKRSARVMRSVLLGQACAACDTPCFDAPVCKACTMGLLKPPRCPRCAVVQRMGALCGACSTKPPAFDAMVCVSSFAAPLAGLVAQLKFEKHLVLAKWFAAQLAPSLGGQTFDAIVPVPLHFTRLQERGFNQAASIAKHLPFPLWHALERVRDTPSQRTVTASQRFSNVRGAFAASRDLAGARLILIDDVVTTGATVQAASLALKRAGAAHITVACIARVN